MTEENSKLHVVSHSDNVEKEEVERADGFFVQWLIGKDCDVDCYMRKYTLAPGGKMVLHKHDNLHHIQYVLKGKMEVTIGNEKYDVRKGSFLLIPEGIPHKYENIGEGEAQFICMIPAVEDMDVNILEK